VGLSGVSPVLPTPFTPTGALDLRSFGRVVEHTLGLGVASVMFPGFASEHFSLTDHERAALLTELLERAGETVVIASVSDQATHAAVNRALRYADLGAGAINLLPPHFGRPPAAAVLDHLAAVLDAVAPVPVVVQYVPAETGTELTPAELVTLRAAYPNLLAVKVECPSPGPFIRALSGVPALVGNAGIDLPEGLRAGAVGVQPGGGFVEVYLEILRQWDAGSVELHTSLARHLRAWAGGFRKSLAMGKAIAWRRGLIDHPHCRLPTPTVHELAEVDRFIEEFSLR
jgi:dihydrodipicolinate synthase/N-acetylneuraminate lyase